MFKFRSFIIIIYYLIINNCIADNDELVLKEVSKNLWVYNAINDSPNRFNNGLIANVTAILGEKYTLVFDAGPSKQFAQKFINQIKSISNNPIKYLIISHRHFDHAYGIEPFIKEGAKIYFDKKEFEYFKTEGPKINKLLIENLGLSESNINFSNVMATSIHFFSGKTVIDLGNRKVLIQNLGNAHTQGDIIIYDFRSKTYVTGDFVFQGRAAAFSDANLNLWMSKLETKLDLPWVKIIPGHGKIIRNNKDLNDTKLWLSFLNKSIIKAISQGDMISEIFEYPMPKALDALIMKDITLRQGIKKQINYYKNKKIIE